MAQSTLNNLLRKRRPPEHEIKAYLSGCGIRVPKGRYLPKGAPLPMLRGLAFPLVAKVVSPLIAGKSDAGGVISEIDGRIALKNAVASLLKIRGARGVLIEEQAKPGLELIVGGVLDPQFGPVVMFGLGGVATEIFRDVVFAAAPLLRDDADWLLSTLKSRRLLEGFRGSRPVDRESLVRILFVVSDMISTGRIAEMDLNPVVAYPDAAIVLDSKIRTL